MKCFNHSANDAVGVCKCCGKGLCQSCLVPGAQALVCVGPCEQYVSKLFVQLAKTEVDQSRDLTTIRSAVKNLSFIGVFFIVTGVSYCAWAQSIDMLDTWLSIMCGAFVVMGLSFFRRAWLLHNRSAK